MISESYERNVLMEAYIQRQVEARNWIVIFIFIITITAIFIMLKDNRLKYLSPIVAGLGGFLAWHIFRRCKQGLKSARLVWLSLEANKIVLGHERGEWVTYLTDLKSVKFNKDGWPEVRLIFKDGRMLSFEGFENLELIAERLKSTLEPQ